MPKSSSSSTSARRPYTKTKRVTLAEVAKWGRSAATKLADRSRALNRTRQARYRVNNPVEPPLQQHEAWCHQATNTMRAKLAIRVLLAMAKVRPVYRKRIRDKRAKAKEHIPRDAPLELRPTPFGAANNVGRVFVRSPYNGD